MLQAFTHYFLHLGFVGLIAIIWDRKNWWKCWLVLLGTMLVDLDHLLVNPIFHPERCSIGYHYLHCPLPILIYLIGFLYFKHSYTRLFCLGLLFHMLTDSIDCIWTFSHCESCYQQSIVHEWMQGF